MAKLPLHVSARPPAVPCAFSAHYAEIVPKVNRNGVIPVDILRQRASSFFGG
jgi:hypothetical protein